MKIERIVHAKGVSGTIRLKHEYEMLKEIHAVTNGKKTQGKKVPGKKINPRLLVSSIMNSA